MKHTILLSTVIVLLAACGMQRKISNLRQSPVSADLTLTEEQNIPLVNIPKYEDKDTVEVNEPGSVLIMNAVKDENGEMTATDVIKAATVTARFRNVAERHGKLDLQFQVRVPEDLQDGKWQLKLDPDMFIMEDSIRLAPVIITGAEYRKKQLKGYEQYQKFLESIITDPNKLVNIKQLELFIKRNIPLLYKFRTDSTYVSDEEFASVYGVTEQTAVEHYTNKFRVNHNERKKERQYKMFKKYVKAPIVSEGIMLDTVIATPNGEFIYNYTQTINTCPGLKKAVIKLSGAIFENGNQILKIPESNPLTFYISSLSAFTDMTEKYLTEVISRRVEANTACYVDFPSGSSEIIIDLGKNRQEIGRIRKNLISLSEDKEYDIDSIIVTASCSPEGLMKYNDALSKRRAASISAYFDKIIKEIRDSIMIEQGFTMDISNNRMIASHTADVKFIANSAGENWAMLDALIKSDTLLTEQDKKSYTSIRRETDQDKREKELTSLSFYKYMREKLYPKLRTVKFDFYLHRKGMIQDTIRTTRLDTLYMSGVQAINDRDYTKAITILRPYGDYNLAVAYCAMDYNSSAMEILNSINKNDRVHYMLAILYSRAGRDKEAIEHYLTSCSMNPSFVHRGNLDPEISILIKKYGLNRETNNEQ